MIKMNTAPQQMAKKYQPVLTDMEIHKIKLKLNDNNYINDAIYKLASILTDRIMNGGLSNEQKEI